jgi:hypothetical protein
MDALTFSRVFRMTPEEKAEFLRREEQEEEERERQYQQKRRERDEQMRLWQLQQMRIYENHKLFLETEGLFVFDPNGSISSRELYGIYRNWCIREKLPIKPPREFWLYVKEKAPQHQLTYSGNIIDSKGSRCRGFRGICALPENREGLPGNEMASNTDNTDNT